MPPLKLTTLTITKWACKLQKLQFLQENYYSLFGSESHAQLLHTSEVLIVITNSGLTKTTLKMWNIARKWRAVSPEQGQPCRASECLPPHLATVELRSRGLSGLHTSCFFGHLTQLGTSCRHFNSWTFVFCILTARKLREKKSPSKE